MKKKKDRDQVEEKSSFTIHRYAETETEKISKRVEEFFDSIPMLDYLMQQFLSYVYNASQKLIDLKVKTHETRIRDEAIIISAARLFNDCFAGYSLAKQGLVLQSIVLLRSAFEVASQSILFIENEDMAKRWMTGKSIQPKEVRAKSPFAAAQKELYKQLSLLSHPNRIASIYYSVPLEETDHQSEVIFYGGAFFPKSAALVSTQFLFAQLVFLESFYFHYKDDLEKSNLLWNMDLKSQDRLGDFTWEKYLKGLRELAEELVAECNRLPEDSFELSKKIREMISVSGEHTHL